MKFFLALCLVVLVSSTELKNYTFEQYVKEYSKSYSPLEYARRKLIFEFNLRNIIAHNEQTNVSYKLGINQFADQASHEIQMLSGYKKSMSGLLRSQSNAEVFTPTGIEVPPSVDWREKGVVTDVKNQGSCGSCWTFAAAETVESHWAIATGNLEVLSEQQITSCTPNPQHCGGSGGCHGGIAQIAFEDIIARGGLASEQSYPYTSATGKSFECQFDSLQTPPVAKLAGYQNIQTNSYQGLLEALATKGPISVSVDASKWSFYKSGVFDGCNTEKPDVNHAVQLVGYGTDPKLGDYWTIRNSWGPRWGENGFIRIRRSGQDTFCGVDTTPSHGSGCDGGPSEVTVCGMCGILFDNTFPIIDTSSITITE